MPCLSRLSSALEELGINRAVGVGRGRPRTPLTDAIGYFDDRLVRAYRGWMRFRRLKEVNLGSFNTHLGLALGGGLAVILAAVGLSKELGPWLWLVLVLGIIGTFAGLAGLALDAWRAWWPSTQAFKAEQAPDIHAANMLLLTELETTAARIEMVRMTRPHPHYSENFSLPTTQWQTFGSVLANNSPGLFRVLATAYKAIQWVNDAQIMRKTRQGGSRLTLAVIDDDRLDDAQTATAAAISALKKATVPGNAGIGVGRRLEAKPKMVGREWAYGRAIEGRLITAFVSATVKVRGLAMDEGLVALTCDLYRNGDPILSLPLSDPSWLMQTKGPQILRDVMFQQTFEQSDYGNAPTATPGDVLEPHVIARFNVGRTVDTVVLPAIRVRGAYKGPGT